MAESSLFPTAYWAEQNAQGVAVIWHKGNSALFDFVPEKMDWQQWHYLVQQTATLLQQQGVTAGDLVAYSGTHRLASLLCYCASLMLEAKILMLNPAMSELQRQKVLQNNGVQRLITEQHFTKFPSELTACNCPEINFHQPATFTLTSGSSGSPKAVVHSLKNHLDNAEGVCELMNFQQPNSWLLSLPLFHVSGQGIVWRWLLVGATLRIAEDKNDFWQALSQVSHASLVPTLLQRYLAQIEQENRPQKILLGGAFIPPTLIALAQSKQIETYAGYGMTEMASTVCAVKNQLDNVGKPLKNRQIQLEQGEIWVKGAGLALGYWLNQQLVPFTNEQGWFATKDKGEWQNGNLVVKGRLDNLFISGGENIQPEEIEKVLFSSGLVAQAIVVPIDDTEFGQRPVAVVEFHREFSTQAVRSLQDFARSHLEKFKLPIAYFPLETGQAEGIKISRQQLQQTIANRLREQTNV